MEGHNQGSQGYWIIGYDAVDLKFTKFFNIQKKLAVETEILHWNPNAITDPALCKDQAPIETQPCSRIPCNGTWVEKNWTKVTMIYF